MQYEKKRNYDICSDKVTEGSDTCRECFISDQHLATGFKSHNVLSTKLVIFPDRHLLLVLYLCNLFFKLDFYFVQAFWPFAKPVGA